MRAAVVRQVALIAAAAVVTAALLILYVQVRGLAAGAGDHPAVEEARQRYLRAHAARPVPEASPVAGERPLPSRPRRPVSEPPPRITDPAPDPAERRLDLHDPPMTGDPEYDRQTRVAVAHKLYDAQDYEGAVAAAKRLLRDQPKDTRLHILIVLAACSMGDVALAREHFETLPEADRRRPLAPCKRANIDLAGK